MVYANPLHSASGTYAHKIGAAYGTGVIIGGHFKILGHLTVGLSKQCHATQYHCSEKRYKALHSK